MARMASIICSTIFGESPSEGSSNRTSRSPPCPAFDGLSEPLLDGIVGIGNEAVVRGEAVAYPLDETPVILPRAQLEQLARVADRHRGEDVIGRGAGPGPAVQLAERQVELEAQPRRRFRIEAAAEAFGEGLEEARRAARFSQDLAIGRGIEPVAAFLQSEPVGAHLQGVRKQVLPLRAVESAEARQERRQSRRLAHVVLSL